MVAAAAEAMAYAAKAITARRVAKGDDGSGAAGELTDAVREAIEEIELAATAPGR